MHKPSWQMTCGYITDAYETLSASEHTMRGIFDLISENGIARYAAWSENGKQRYMRYKDMAQLTAGIAAEIQNIIPSEATMIALHLANGPYWPPIFWAILMSGHVPLLLSADLPLSQYESILTDNCVRYVITEEPHENAVSPAKLVSAKNADPALFTEIWENQVIFLTSGTTGSASLMVYNGNCLIGQLRSIRYFYRYTVDLIYPNANGSLKQLALLPFSHIFGFSICILWYAFFGKQIVYPASYSLKVLMDTVRVQKITHICAVPVVYDGIVKAISSAIKQKLGARAREFIDWLCGSEVRDSSKLLKYKRLSASIRKLTLGKHIRFLISGGAQLSKNTSVFLNRLGYYFANGYGMTELGVIAVEMSDSENIRAQGSIGRPFYGAEFSVSEDGELLVSCEYGAAAKMEKGELTPLPDPFPTRDLAHALPDGRYMLYGRMDDVFIDANGNRIHPAEIEKYFSGIEGVTNVCIIESGGRKIGLFVSNSDSPNAISEEINKRNSRAPFSFTISDAYLTNALPVTGKMEFNRRRILEMYQKSGLSLTALAVHTESLQENVPEELITEIRLKASELLALPVDAVDIHANLFSELGGDSLMYFALLEWLEKHYSVSLAGASHEQLSSVYRCASAVNTMRGKKE
ncbi:MAG: non-ribosomal peptide synthetase [Clostridia bacterium]|nr:non-ribosomal peptide synthetase [Clostridia bacterium]